MFLHLTHKGLEVDAFFICFSVLVQTRRHESNGEELRKRGAEADSPAHVSIDERCLLLVMPSAFHYPDNRFEAHWKNTLYLIFNHFSTTELKIEANQFGVDRNSISAVSHTNGDRFGFLSVSQTEEQRNRSVIKCTISWTLIAPLAAGNCALTSRLKPRPRPRPRPR